MFCPPKFPVVRPDAMKDGVFEAPAQGWQLSKDAAAYLRQRCWMGMAGPGFINQLIGFMEKLQENPIFHRKIWLEPLLEMELSN